MAGGVSSAQHRSTQFGAGEHYGFARDKEAEMTQAGQRLTAAGKEDHVEVDGFRIRYWESGPPRPAGTVVMLEGMTWGLSTLRDTLAQKYLVMALELPGCGASPVNT